MPLLGSPVSSGHRLRRDRCPGVVRPWPADDGPLVRVRLVGGRITAGALAGLARIAAEHSDRSSDGDLHLTSRGNLQLRGVRHGEEFLREVEALGLLPSRHHDQARNIVCSPLSGLRGGLLDARPLAATLDEAIRAEERLGGPQGLPGRFLFSFDDGRGDLAGRETDLGFVALDATTVQLRVGPAWGEVVPATEAPARLVRLAHRFLDARGEDEHAAWHVDELTGLDGPLAPTRAWAGRYGVPHSEPPAPGSSPGLVGVPDGRLTPELTAQITELTELTGPGGGLVLTPWHSVVIEELIEP